jgi:hypothetical protein
MSKTATAITVALVFLAMFLAVEVEAVQANPWIPVSLFKDVPPPEGTQAPIVSIHTPQNGSFYPKNVTLTYDVIFPKRNSSQYQYGVSELYYKGSWNPESTVIPKDKFGAFANTFGAFPNISYLIDLSDVPEGNRWITVYAVGVGLIEKGSEVADPNNYTYNDGSIMGSIKEDPFQSYTYYDRFEMTGYSTVSFVKDLVPPTISFQSAQNTTYTVPDVKLDFTVNEGVSQILYSLDNEGNQTIPGNSTLTGLLNGEHYVTLYVADLAGNAASPKTLFFDVNSPEPFPIVAAAAAIISSIALCAGLLVYFKKRQRGKSP